MSHQQEDDSPDVCVTCGPTQNQDALRLESPGVFSVESGTAVLRRGLCPALRAEPGSAFLSTALGVRETAGSPGADMTWALVRVPAREAFLTQPRRELGWG